MHKKKNLLEKIVKKDYNNELEKVLETKQFDEHVKSTLLSILYKIEAAYKDLETVKKDVQTKEEYVANIIEIIKNNCDSIKIIRMNDEENKIPNNKTYIVDKENKTIIAYPIERKILYAIAKISKKDKIIKDDYFLINETLSELINVGNNINMVEPLRDFNGYSWTTIPQEIESIDHNLIYQILRILVGHKFLNKWVRNDEFIIDYFYLFKEELEGKYGKENMNRLIDILAKISILLSIKSQACTGYVLSLIYLSSFLSLYKLYPIKPTIDITRIPPIIVPTVLVMLCCSFFRVVVSKYCAKYLLNTSVPTTSNIEDCLLDIIVKSINPPIRNKSLNFIFVFVNIHKAINTA